MTLQSKAEQRRAEDSGKKGTMMEGGVSPC